MEKTIISFIFAKIAEIILLKFMVHGIMILANFNFINFSKIYKGVKFMKKFATILLALVLAFVLTGGAVLAIEVGQHAEVWDRTDWPDTLRIGVLPEEDVAVMQERYEPFKAHFEEILDIEVELYFGTSFTAMVEAMRGKDIEVSKFGPFAYILAVDRAGAEAIVQGAMERFLPTYSSYIIVHADSGIESIDDLEGKSFGWVDPASASGYLFPRAHLVRETGIDTDDLDDWLGEIVYTGGHDAGVRAIISQDVDAAAVSDSQIFRMEAAEVEGMDQVKVLTQTDPIPRSPEAVRGDLPQSLKTAITFAYLSFNDESFLTDHNYHEGFILVDDSAYDILRETSSLLGLSPEDLL